MDGLCLEQAERYALSDDDIKRLLGSDIKITTYPDLEHTTNVDELFDSRGRAIIFFPQQSQQSGHWTCMIKKGRKIEFFDPYGEKPDAQKSGLSHRKLEQLHMDRPLLGTLLLDSPYPITFNKVQLQELNDDVQTCGRHCVCRLLYHKYNLQQYRDIIRRSNESPDEFVVKHTYDELGK